MGTAMVKILVTLKNLDTGELVKKIFEGQDDFECFKQADKWAKENKHDIYFFEVLRESQ
jgi:tRNA U38,U39,U40 pseudouridine synthase TruA